MKTTTCYPVLSKIVYRYQVMNMTNVSIICNQTTSPNDGFVYTYISNVYNYESQLTDLQRRAISRDMVIQGLCSKMVLLKRFSRFI